MTLDRGSVNKTILIGRTGSDPEFKYTQSGKAKTSFGLATTEVWKDDAGAPQEKTTWHRIIAWGKMAEICNQLLKKGYLIYVDGKIAYRQYEDDNQIKRSITEIHLNGMQVLARPKPADQTHEPSPDGVPEAEAEQMPAEPIPDDLPF